MAGWLTCVKCHPVHDKSCGFDDQSGHIPRLQVQPPMVGSHMGGN